MDPELENIQPDGASIALLATLMAAGGIRLDDGETALLARQLEYVKTQTYDILYSKLKSREFIPISGEVDVGAETWTYRQWDWRGMAKIVANYADDLPLVDALVKEFPQRIVDIADAYQWSIKDLRRAAKSGVPIDTKKAQAARNAIERKMDDIAAFGDTASNIPGFLNNANVPVVNLTNGAWLSTATADEIMADLFELEQAIIDQSEEVHEADTLLLPTAHYGKIATTKFSTNSDFTILQWFLKNAQTIKTVGRWNKLATADGGSPRALAYQRSPDVVELMIPLEFEQLPPEKRNLTYLVACLGRIGGVCWYRPLAAAYGDGI